MFRMDMTQMYINTFGSWIFIYLLGFNNVYQPHWIIYVGQRARLSMDCNTMVTHQILTAAHESGFAVQLTKIYVRNPDYDYTKLMTKVSLKMLNYIEMSATGPSGICVNL